MHQHLRSSQALSCPRATINAVQWLALEPLPGLPHCAQYTDAHLHEQFALSAEVHLSFLGQLLL